MVHDKKRSGDPDYDDKQPLDQQIGEVVTTPDGKTVRVTEATGPTDVHGAHVNLDDPKGTAGDNRPAPGGVATEPSEVQTYDAPDVAGAETTTMAKPAKKAAAPKAAGTDK